MRRTRHSLELDDLVVELQRLVRPTLELHDVRHLRMDDGQLGIDVLLCHVLQGQARSTASILGGSHGIKAGLAFVSLPPLTSL